MLDRHWANNLHLVLLGIFALAFGLRAWGLGAQPALDDEVGAAFAAANYVEHGLLGQIMWYHPPLRNLVVYASGQALGEYSAWGLRAGSVIMGSITAPLLGYVAWGLFKSRPAAWLAALFLAIDPLHISFSREAFQGSTTPFLMVLGVLFCIYAIRKDNFLLACLSGLAFGLAAASKWHGLFPWALSALAYIAGPWITGQDRGRSVWGRVLYTAAAYVALPVAVYVAVYLPWLRQGHSMAELASLQVWLAKYQYNHEALGYDTAYLSRRAWQWFIWPTAYPDFVFSEGRAYLNVAMGNFLVWALTLPALLIVARDWLRDRAFGLAMALALFLVSYLPLVFTGRGIWVFSAPAVIPFAFLLSAYAVSALLESRLLPLKALAAYLIAVVVLSALMYPMATFRALDYDYLKPVAAIYSPHDGDWPAQGEKERRD